MWAPVLFQHWQISILYIYNRSWRVAAQLLTKIMLWYLETVSWEFSLLIMRSQAVLKNNICILGLRLPKNCSSESKMKVFSLRSWRFIKLSLNDRNFNNFNCLILFFNNLRYIIWTMYYKISLTNERIRRVSIGI